MKKNDDLTNSKKMCPSANSELIRKEEFSKGTPLASVIWERDELKEVLAEEENSNPDWMSKLTSRIGKIASEIEKDETQFDEVENELIKTAALSLVWIERIRDLRRKMNYPTAKDGWVS